MTSNASTATFMRAWSNTSGLRFARPASHSRIVRVAAAQLLGKLAQAFAQGAAEDWVFFARPFLH
jgi:hypothetical protein